jgi:hypothetical protein
MRQRASRTDRRETAVTPNYPHGVISLSVILGGSRARAKGTVPVYTTLKDAKRAMLIYLVLFMVAGTVASTYVALHVYIMALTCAGGAASAFCGWSHMSGWILGHNISTVAVANAETARAAAAAQAEAQRVAVAAQRAAAEAQAVIAQREAVATRVAEEVEALGVVPGRAYIYVIAFNTGVVKVGQTMLPARRFAEHRREAEAFGVWITNFWISAQHSNYLDVEAELIDACWALYPRSRREYFQDADFMTVARIAAKLRYVIYT